MKIQNQNSPGNVAQPINDLKIDLEKKSNHSTLESINPEISETASCDFIAMIYSIWTTFIDFISYLFGSSEENKEKDPSAVKCEEAKPQNQPPEPVVSPTPPRIKVESPKKEESKLEKFSKKVSPMKVPQRGPDGFAVPLSRVPSASLNIQNVIDQSPRATARAKLNRQKAIRSELKSVFSRPDPFTKSEKKRSLSLPDIPGSPKPAQILAAVKRKDSMPQFPDINKEIVDSKTGNTFLHYLVQNEGTDEFTDCKFTCTSEHIQLFIQEYFFDNMHKIKNAEKQIALHYSQSLQTTMVLWGKGKPWIVEELQDNLGQTPVHVIEDAQSIKYILDADKTLATTGDRSGNTPLHLFTFLNPEKAKILIDAGADVNTQNQEGLTPLGALILRGDQEEDEHLLDNASFLIKNGAKVDLQVGKTGKSIAQLIKERGYQGLLSD